jgi:type II secretory pathway component PulF
LYSLKNTSGSSSLLPLKTGITMLIFILSYKKHTKLINSFDQLSLSFYNLSSWIRKFPMARIALVIKLSLSFHCKTLKGPDISNLANYPI